MKIVIFAAALRKTSLNRLLAIQSVQLLRKETKHQIDYRDFHEFEMPIYNGDLEEMSGIPEGGIRFVEMLSGADAIIISTPEYNGGIPGALKNALDWASRHEPVPISGKPLLLLYASPGSLGGVRGLWHTRVPLEALGAIVFPEMFGLQKADEAFGPDGTFKDHKTEIRLEALLRKFISVSERLTQN
ncbi:MAG: NADPH-dependent FMN reductase [Bdellovibrionota bacterium]